MSTKIGFIGAGNMANCIIAGLLEQGFKPSSIWASDPLESNLTRLSDSYGIHTLNDNVELARQADILFFAVKPQTLEQVCQQIGTSLRENSLIISIAAGIPIEKIESWLGTPHAIVRCMPNTPAQVLKGATGMFANPLVSQGQKQITESIFKGIGLAKWIANEHLLHAVTALSGSGPAYIFLLIEAMMSAAEKLGLSAEEAKVLAAQTVAGGAEMVLKNEIAPAQLKRNVMSPGGTTERAIASFEADNFTEIVERAMTAAFERSIEMAESL